MNTLNDPVFYTPGTAWIVDQAKLVDGVYRSYFKNESLECVAIRYPGVQLVEMEDAMAQIRATVVRPVSAVSKDAFIDALECLPPNQWQHSTGAESFKMCEHYSGNITSIYARIGRQYFTLRDDCNLPHAEIIRRCRAAIEAQDKAVLTETNDKGATA